VFALRRVSDGMAQNAAIAVYAAIRIGVENENVRSRILSWNPPPLRGEWRFSEGRRIYLDCYNANPASMADALAAFDAVAPGDEPRLFVIGCMEELGGESRRYHVELGRSLALRKGDQLVAVGPRRSHSRGRLERGCDPSRSSGPTRSGRWSSGSRRSGGPSS
jgi:UDP-N-acetylmuramoyl-tripeptide--D-alanyl-D-alanine ligase